MASAPRADAKGRERALGLPVMTPRAEADADGAPSPLPGSLAEPQEWHPLATATDARRRTHVMLEVRTATPLDAQISAQATSEMLSSGTPTRATPR